MKTLLLLLFMIFILFSCCPKSEEQRIEYKKTAKITYMDYNIDTVSVVVYSNSQPYFSLTMYGDAPYLTISVNDDGFGYNQNYKIIAYDVRSFEEISKP